MFGGDFGAALAVHIIGDRYLAVRFGEQGKLTAQQVNLLAFRFFFDKLPFGRGKKDAGLVRSCEIKK